MFEFPFTYKMHLSRNQGHTTYLFIRLKLVIRCNEWHIENSGKSKDTTIDLFLPSHRKTHLINAKKRRID